MDEKVIRISRRKLVVLAVIIVIVIILGWIVLSSMSSARNRASFDIGNAPTALDGGSLVTTSIAPSDYYGEQKSSIADTREFLKTSYSATIKTRNVAEKIKDVRNAVKGADGRVDNFYSSEKRGSLTFVVAKSKFEELRSEIEGLDYAKLYVESISSQNLLSQKQRIENQTENVLTNLETLSKQKQDLITKHTQSVNSISKELTRIRTELADVRATLSEETDSSVIVLLREQETSLIGQEGTQKQRLNTENSNYAVQSQNLERLTANANNNLTNVNKQDTQFAENIETVNGTVSVVWVSWWQLVKIYSPISPIIIIIILVVIIWIIGRRRGYLPKIVLE
ncbi:MAG: DUF4349 domain-containing protein [Candidatus Paceibacterota bacterium]|jgi:uncharacterized phage infection (PIP) family protein YhgE